MVARSCHCSNVRIILESKTVLLHLYAFDLIGNGEAFVMMSESIMNSSKNKGAGKSEDSLDEAWVFSPVSCHEHTYLSNQQKPVVNWESLCNPDPHVTSKKYWNVCKTQKCDRDSDECLSFVVWIVLHNGLWTPTPRVLIEKRQRRIRLIKGRETFKRAMRIYADVLSMCPPFPGKRQGLT